MRLRRALRVALVVLVALLAGVLAPGTSLAAGSAAHTARFEIDYYGAGQYTAKQTTPTSPGCGEVTNVRTEDTHFSWVTTYKVTMHFGADGFSSHTATGHSKSSPLGDNDSKVDYTETGCQTGSASCHGESEPQPGTSAKLDVPGAKVGGSSRFAVEALGGYEGYTAKDFSGSWTNIAGATSCAQWFEAVPELLVGEYGVPAQQKASFPVHFATLDSLKAGHYFKVTISPGHYAPEQDTHGCGEGCSEHLSWKGYVKTTRLG
jgi:hypothetical protein